MNSLSDADKEKILGIRKHLERFGVLDNVDKAFTGMQHSEDFDKLLEAAVEASTDESDIHPEVYDHSLIEGLTDKKNPKNLMIDDDDYFGDSEV